MYRHTYVTLTCIFFTASTISRGQHCKVTVKVTDYDTGTIITNAQIGLSVDTNIKPGWGWGSGKPNRYMGESDENGICILAGKGNGATASVFAKKDGYYGSSGYGIHFTNVTGIIRRKWQPWNPTIHIVMKRMINPVPLFTKRVEDQVILNEYDPVGFDLLAGDWVSPHGKGKRSDFLLKLTRKQEQIVKKTVINRTYDEVLYDIILFIRGPNEGDGFFEVPITTRHGGSSLRMPRTAPASGYMQEIKKRNYRDSVDKPTRHNIDENMNYFFRVRTVLDADGNVESALYGKIHGDVQLDHNGEFGFVYYLNPTPNDRNLEFDRKRNLFEERSSS